MIDIINFCKDTALLGLELWEKQEEILQEFMSKPYQIGVLSLGRRSGKTLMSAVVAVYCGCMLADEYKKKLRKNEKFYIITVANSQDQARIALSAIKDLILNSPLIQHLVIKEVVDELHLSNGCIFKAIPASSRTGRGMACGLLIMDEAGFFVDGAETNVGGDAIYQALAPSVAQFGELGRILILSTPWLKKGIFWELFTQAKSGEYADMYLKNLPTWEVNPTIPQTFFDRERERNPEMFEVEYGANFAEQLGQFLRDAVIEDAIDKERKNKLPTPIKGIEYYLSLDPAKGGGDDYVACISHWDKQTKNPVLVVDYFHEFKGEIINGTRHPIQVTEVEEWICYMNSKFNFNYIIFDQYNSQSSIQKLRKKYNNPYFVQEIHWTIQSKMDAYTKLRELFNSGRISLPNNKKIKEQMKNLTVTYNSNGTWSVSGGDGKAVDDYVSALAGIIVIATKYIKFGSREIGALI